MIFFLKKHNFYMGFFVQLLRFCAMILLHLSTVRHCIGNVCVEATISMKINERNLTGIETKNFVTGSFQLNDIEPYDLSSKTLTKKSQKIAKRSDYVILTAICLKYEQCIENYNLFLLLLAYRIIERSHCLTQTRLSTTKKRSDRRRKNAADKSAYSHAKFNLKTEIQTAHFNIYNTLRAYDTKCSERFDLLEA